MSGGMVALGLVSVSGRFMSSWRSMARPAGLLVRRISREVHWASRAPLSVVGPPVGVDKMFSGKAVALQLSCRLCRLLFCLVVVVQVVRGGGLIATLVTLPTPTSTTFSRATLNVCTSALTLRTNSHLSPKAPLRGPSSLPFYSPYQ